MNFPPNPPSSTASGSDNYSSARSGRPQQSVWGRPPSQAGTRQGLALLATSDLSSGAAFGARRSVASNSPGPYSSTTSPLTSTFSSVLSSSSRLAGSRHLSSTSSTGSPLTLFQAGAQQQPSFPSGQSVTSPRSRTVTPLSQLASTASSQSAAQAGVGAAGFSSAGGGATRSGTYSPSLSGTNIGSPTAYSFDRPTTQPSGSSSAAGGQSSLSKISVAQVLLLLDSISEKEGKAKWESKADQIRKVRFLRGLLKRNETATDTLSAC
jgi:CCR4-NOT transcription complex subunit 1